MLSCDKEEMVDQNLNAPIVAVKVADEYGRFIVGEEGELPEYDFYRSAQTRTVIGKPNVQITVQGYTSKTKLSSGVTLFTNSSISDLGLVPYQMYAYTRYEVRRKVTIPHGANFIESPNQIYASGTMGWKPSNMKLLSYDIVTGETTSTEDARYFVTIIDEITHDSSGRDLGRTYTFPGGNLDITDLVFKYAYSNDIIWD